MTGIEPGPNKSVLRRQYKDLRRRFNAAEDTHVQRSLQDNLKKLIEELGAEQCCLYRGRPDEAPCQLDPVTAYYYPVLADQDLTFRRPLKHNAFRKGPFDLEEPAADQSEPLVMGRSTVVCAPAVAVDAYGGRLGMGRGYYDRFFASNADVIRVGVVYHFQFSQDRLPAESWDEPVDWIVSEKMILRTFAKRSS